MQEKLLAAIKYRQQIIACCRQLQQAAEILSIPVSATEQYPKGLGRTETSLRESMSEIPEKLRFSCATTLDWLTDRESPRHQVVVAGIESHVCVMQTAYDLLSQGFRVTIPADAVGSRKKFDWKMALRRLEGAGAIITSTEAVLFEWCETAERPEFKAISKLVTGR
jgi:isochorismate hydrolase